MDDEITGEEFLREVGEIRSRMAALQARLLAKGPISSDWVAATIWLSAALQLIETQATAGPPSGQATFVRPPGERDTEPPSPEVVS